MVGDTTKKEKIRFENGCRQWAKEWNPRKSLRECLSLEGETVAAYGEMTMKNEKGEENNYEFCDIYRFENDKIAQLRSFVIKVEQ